MKKTIIPLMLIATVYISVSVSHGNAAIINATSCSQADVQESISYASSGDTVSVPSGECTWDDLVDVPSNKKLVLVGDGIDSTIITGAFNLYQSGSRVTGFTFQGTRVKVDGNGWRIDHCKFVDLSGVSVRGNLKTAHPTGLVDNCTFITSKVAITGWADLISNDLWTLSADLGADGNAENVVYVEDCSFTHLLQGNAIDTNYGGAYVFRYNTSDHPYIECHSVQGNHRATRKWEVYGNIINNTGSGIYTPFRLRAGTGVVFDNSIIGNWTRNVIGLDNVRSVNGNIEPGGLCDGASLWDGNETINHDTHYGDSGTGKHTGDDGECTNNCATLVDSTKSWNVDVFIYDYLANPGATVYNTTDGSSCRITDNTGTTITCVLAGGTDNDWDINDDYKIVNGYPCRDQIGRGPDSPIWVNDPPGVYTQPLLPAYAWMNKKEANVEVLFAALYNQDGYIKSDRDYYNYDSGFDGTSGVGAGTLASRPATCTKGVAYWATDQSCSDLTGMVGANHTINISGTLYKCTAPNTWTEYYKPYTYPHPLQKPSLPLNLRIVD